MNNIIRCPEELPLKRGDMWVFLAGPIQGAPDWQSSIEELPEIEGVTFLSPRRKNNPKGSEDSTNVFSDKDYAEQVEWETKGLRYCDLVLFWIPSPIVDVPGRAYAQTTRFELGENLARGKNIILGVSEDIPGRRYFLRKASDYNQGPVLPTLESCLKALEIIVKEKKNNPKVFFTTDTHFGSKRTLEFSRRPFSSVEEMDEKMIENWNKIVSPWDTVYHLGDFGDTSVLQLLNGKKILVMGNYEEEEKNQGEVSFIDYILKGLEKGWSKVVQSPYIPDEEIIPGYDIVLSHKPSAGQRFTNQDCYYLFGHIHRLQMIKKRGLCVSQDCHNFFPVSQDDVRFFLEAQKNGYYDDEVYSV